jgi:hypothetical protein
MRNFESGMAALTSFWKVPAIQQSTRPFPQADQLKTTHQRTK